MSRALLKSLRRYRETWTTRENIDAERQRENVDRFIEFVRNSPACLLRTNAAGHVTGSVLVVTPDYENVLLTLHRKLGIWLQLGGHADGEESLHEVARKEGLEESGLDDLQFFGDDGEPSIFDVDIHLIPARKDEPEHLHFDVRFLATTESAEDIVMSAESKDLRWFRLEDAYGVTDEWAMRRQFDKVRFLRGRQFGKGTFAELSLRAPGGAGAKHRGRSPVN